MDIVVSKTAFWSFVALLCYTYVGYPLLAMTLARYRGKKGIVDNSPGRRDALRVTVIVAAYNEEAAIAERLVNLGTLDYPATQIEIIVASDGSTDQTNGIVSAWPDPSVRLLMLPRGGRALAHNCAARLAMGEILVFTDARTSFQRDFLLNLVRPFSDPKVGCVVGRLIYTAGRQTVAEDTGLYWRYETKLRESESDAGLLAVGSGCCMAVRRRLFAALHEDEDLDDAVPLDVRLQGYQVAFVKEALAFDTAPSTCQDEIRARARMTTLSMTAILRRRVLLNPFHFSWIALALLSHRILRFLTPVLVVGAFLSSVLLTKESLYYAALLAQCMFYLSSLIGWVAWGKTSRVALFRIPVSFCVWNIGFAAGLVRVLRRETVTAYKPV